MRLLEKVKSTVLGIVLVKILSKLKNRGKNEFFRTLQVVGFRKVRKMVGYAIEWGSTVAGNWVGDVGFARYLTLVSA